MFAEWRDRREEAGMMRRGSVSLVGSEGQFRWGRTAGIRHQEPSVHSPVTAPLLPLARLVVATHNLLLTVSCRGKAAS